MAFPRQEREDSLGTSPTPLDVVDLRLALNETGTSIMSCAALRRGVCQVVGKDVAHAITARGLVHGFLRLRGNYA